MASIQYIGEKPEPDDPITIAIIAKISLDYDNEAIGDDIWGEPDDVDDDEVYDSLVSCIWPACTELEFSFITENMLSKITRLPINDIAKTARQLDQLIADIELLDHVFLCHSEDTFEEISVEKVRDFSSEYTIEFIEYETT